MIKRLFLALLALVLFIGFCSLGVWQIQRRAWKLDLIAQVEQRATQPAVQAPGPDQWPNLSNRANEYTHVRATGTLHPGQSTLVQAATDLGSGYWVLTPLTLDGGGTVMVNRGFVLPEWRKRPQTEALPDQATVTGLLRMSEVGGGFLRRNKPAEGLWYSRDTQAMADARGIGKVAPYFIDAERGSGPPPDPRLEPVPGLTVLQFSNNHLSYALTWFGLAIGVLIAVAIVRRESRRPRQDD